MPTRATASSSPTARWPRRCASPREQGIGAVGVRNASHCGAIGLYTRAAARAGCVGVAFTHADSVAVPHGGKRAFLGTNPISFAFPRDGREPLCLDMATTSIPFNRVRNARREGHALPPDVAVDAQGAPTTDAQAAVAVVPLGGSAYGHKGYALALVIDLLCGPLLGNPYGPHIPSMFEAIDEPRQLGAFFIALDPAALWRRRRAVGADRSDGARSGGRTGIAAPAGRPGSRSRRATQPRRHPDRSRPGRTVSKLQRAARPADAFLTSNQGPTP